MEILTDKSARAASGFLKRLINRAPFKITRILTDNGKEFTDRFTTGSKRRPTGSHPFDRLCSEHNIEHRLIKPYKPQTDGMVKRFNGRISETLSTSRFKDSNVLKKTLTHYLHLSISWIPQRALGHITPIQALNNWQKKKPRLLKKTVYNFAAPDN